MIPDEPRRRLAADDVIVVSALAAAVAILARGSGGYNVAVWGPAGALLAVAAAALLAVGFRTTKLVAAGAGLFAAAGLWSLASTQWGGLPNQAWRYFDQSLIAAGALVLGSLLAAAGKSRLVMPAVLAGIVVNAGEIVGRGAFEKAPDQWFYGRRFQGAIGYQSAQASLAAIGLALSVALLANGSRAVRAAAGASAGLMVAIILLTQSRAGALAGALCLVVTVAVLRDIAALLRAVPVAVGAGILVAPLKDLDRALVDHAGVHPAFHSYALWSIAVMIGIAVCALPALGSRRVRLSLLAATAVAVLAGAVATTIVELRPGSAAHHLADTLRHLDTDPSLEAGPGSTRILSLSLNGRRDAWRVAWSMVRSDPVVGQGQGTYAIEWTKKRHLDQLYILQPHSLELELFSELGAIGLALFAGAIGLVVAGVVLGRRDRIVVAAAAGVLVAVVGEASVDWIWSFPVLVAALLVVVGAAAGGRRAGPPSPLLTVAASLVLLVLLTSFAAPWLSNRRLRQARATAAGNPAASADRLDSAVRWNRWDPSVHEWAGVVAERAGDETVAAADYAKAATLSQSPWLERILEARAAKAGGDRRRALRACAAAHQGNPGRTHLYEEVCE
jgi:hypothetical protein